MYIQTKKGAATTAAENGGGNEITARWDDVDVVGALLKMGIPTR